MKRKKAFVFCVVTLYERIPSLLSKQKKNVKWNVKKKNDSNDDEW